MSPFIHLRMSAAAMCVLVVLSLGSKALRAQTTAVSLNHELHNGGMEEAGERDGPQNWHFVGRGGGKVQLDLNDPFTGKAAAQIDSTAGTGAEQDLFSNLMQTIDAAHWQGKKVRFRGAVRTADESDNARVQMWFRVDRKSEGEQQPIIGAFDNMDDRPIRTTTWKHFDIVLPVDPDAQRLNVGFFVIGKARAWLDDATLEAVDDDTPATAQKIDQAVARRRQLPPAVMKAFAEAERSPQQPFFTHWIWLALLAMIMSVIAMSSSAVPADIPPGGTPPNSSLVAKFSIRFAVIYWGLYCFPKLVASLLPVVGWRLSNWYSSVNSVLVEWMARTVFGLQRELVPPNGSGDTTYSYLTILALFVISVAGAVAWSLIDRRKTYDAGMRDLLRSYLRYALAFAMLGYGIAKVSLEMNQFPEISTFQLNKTWGSSSPMNVLWAFMGASRPYTIFAGLGELLAAVLLIWRRTMILGALVAMGVMTNVMVLNFCYDVPVKIYSTHLVVMSVMIILPDARRLANVFVFNRTTEPVSLSGVWQGRWLWWLHLVVKSAVVVFMFLLPLGSHAWTVSQQISRKAVAQQASPSKPDFPLTKRGFRWINEVPFNR